MSFTNETELRRVVQQLRGRVLAARVLDAEAPREAAPPMYELLRHLFQAGVFFFYHTVENHGVSKVPPRGRPGLVCINHGNSLTDSVVAISIMPRFMRFTCKDTLFKTPLFGQMIRASGAIGLQRKQEHDNPDNSQALQAIVDEMATHHSCVCMFPEGRSRFWHGVGEMKKGGVRVVLDAVQQKAAAGDKDFDLFLLPCGLTYLHREKFRSNVLFEYGEPILVNYKEYGEMPLSDAVARLWREMDYQMRLLTIDASDWDLYCAAHTARSLFSNVGTGVSLAEHVQVAKFWAKALQLHNPADPGLVPALLRYQDELEAVQLKDHRFASAQPTAATVLVRLALRLLQMLLILPFAVFGTLSWAPTFVACKMLERNVMRRTIKAPNHSDEVAQYKMAAGLFCYPSTAWVLGVLAAWWWTSLPVARVLLLSPLWTGLMMFLMFVGLRMIEDGFASLRSFLSNVRLLFLPAAKFQRLHGMRADLYTRILAHAAFSLGSDDFRPSDVPPPHKSAYANVVGWFSLKRRRKKDWGEVLRLHTVVPRSRGGQIQTPATPQQTPLKHPSPGDKAKKA